MCSAVRRIFSPPSPRIVVSPPPPPPPPPPPQPEPVNPPVQKARSSEYKRRTRSEGRQATVLGGQITDAPANQPKKQLKGSNTRKVKRRAVSSNRIRKTGLLGGQDSSSPGNQPLKTLLGQ